MYALCCWFSSKLSRRMQVLSKLVTHGLGQEKKSFLRLWFFTSEPSHFLAKQTCLFCIVVGQRGCFVCFHHIFFLSPFWKLYAVDFLLIFDLRAFFLFSCVFYWFSSWCYFVRISSKILKCLDHSKLYDWHFQATPCTCAFFLQFRRFYIFMIICCFLRLCWVSLFAFFFEFFLICAHFSFTLIHPSPCWGPVGRIASPSARYCSFDVFSPRTHPLCPCVFSWTVWFETYHCRGMHPYLYMDMRIT